MLTKTLSISFISLLLFIGCGDDNITPKQDASLDAKIDATTQDAKMDAIIEDAKLDAAFFDGNMIDQEILASCELLDQKFTEKCGELDNPDDISCEEIAASPENIACKEEGNAMDQCFIDNIDQIGCEDTEAKVCQNEIDAYETCFDKQLEE